MEENCLHFVITFALHEVLIKSLINILISFFLFSGLKMQSTNCLTLTKSNCGKRSIVKSGPRSSNQRLLFMPTRYHRSTGTNGIFIASSLSLRIAVVTTCLFLYMLLTSCCGVGGGGVAAVVVASSQKVRNAQIFIHDN